MSERKLNMNIFYQELLNIQGLEVEFIGNSQIFKESIRGFSINSKTIQPDEIFVAIKGDNFDGHKFVGEVIENGNEINVVSRQWYQENGKQFFRGNFFIVKNTLTALQKISQYYRLKFDIPVLAITGSNGKTTTKEMVSAVLETKLNVLKNPGNLNNHIGVPLTLFSLNENQDIAVTEMGANHKGEIAALAEIAQPDYGLITNIGPAHLEFFGSLEGVFQAKSELWSFLEKNSGCAFVNVDDPFLAVNIPAAKKVVKYGFENDADVTGKLLNIDEQGRAAFLVAGEEIKLKIAGVHNINNALAAFVVGRELGIEPEKIKHVLENFEPADKRMEIVKIKGLRIVNDCYNSNPASARKAIQTISQMQTNSNRIAVLGDMFELGELSEKEHGVIGEYIADFKNINYLVTIGKYSEFTSKAAEESGMQNVLHFEKKDELVKYLKSICKFDDIILIKGSRGMKMEEVTKGLMAIL
ncbi:hypothetical protein B6I21_06445 [candidate division KSB1 bacterium 4572_119]|nr:MAG: hypothetical protein B6I21_06445 [candidate division KSB1 bacterium 4572_119]